MKRYYFAILFLGLVSCQVPSKVMLSGDGGRNAYNQTLQQTNNEQMLLNLVRLRHLDFPYFLDVTNVTTQTTVGSSVSPLLSIPWNNSNPSSLGGHFSWQNQPTVVYYPLEGEAFSKRIFEPLPIIMIQRLAYSGWEIDRILRVMLQTLDSIPNAPSASGPAPETVPEFETFLRIATLLRVLQREDELVVGIEHDDTGYTLQVSFPKGYAESEELVAILGHMEEKDGRYYALVKQGLDSRGEVGIMSRSLLGCMYYLSLGVEVPRIDCVPCTKNKDGSHFHWSKMMDGLFTVICNRKKPARAAIAVQYRGFWYYIDEQDISSKRTFMLLMQLYSFHTASASQTAPILTLPIGK